MRHKDAKADCLDNLKFVRESIRKIMDHTSMDGEDQVFNHGSLRALWHSLDIELNPKMRFLRLSFSKESSSVDSFSNTTERANRKLNTMDKTLLVEIIRLTAEMQRDWISTTEESKEAHILMASALDDLAYKVERNL